MELGHGFEGQCLQSYICCEGRDIVGRFGAGQKVGQLGRLEGEAQSAFRKWDELLFSLETENAPDACKTKPFGQRLKDHQVLVAFIEPACCVSLDAGRHFSAKMPTE